MANRVVAALWLPAVLWTVGCLAQPPGAAAPRANEPVEVGTLIDSAERALGTNGSNISAILSDSRYVSVHGWPRFRAAIKAHARGPGVTIVTPREPGTRLRVRMRLIEADGSPSVGALVYAYHTDARGDYGPNDAHVPPVGSDNNYARLFGYATTDTAGTITVETIRPGGYSDSTAPAHIHVRIWCRDKRSFGAEVWFDDDPRVTAEAREEAARDRIVICPVAIDAEGRASIDATIRLD